MFSNFFFFFEKCRLRDNVEKYGRCRQATDGTIEWRMRIACWISKATELPSEYVILVAFPRQHRLQERASNLGLYVLCPSCSNEVCLCSL